MGAAGLGAVIGWCSVWYVTAAKARGWTAAAALIFAGMVSAYVAAGDSANLVLLSAMLIAALAHVSLRLLLFQVKGARS